MLRKIFHKVRKFYAENYLVIFTPFFNLSPQRTVKDFALNMGPKGRIIKVYAEYRLMLPFENPSFSIIAVFYQPKYQQYDSQNNMYEPCIHFNLAAIKQAPQEIIE